MVLNRRCDLQVRDRGIVFQPWGQFRIGICNWNHSSLYRLSIPFPFEISLWSTAFGDAFENRLSVGFQGYDVRQEENV